MATLNIWVVYDHPLDYPNNIVARRWECAPGVKITDDVVLKDTLQSMRIEMMERGLNRIQRHDRDDPKIVEVWL
jgi:hypothetical protein